MHSTWAVILIICAARLCFGHLPFFGYYTKSKNDSKVASGIRLNNLTNIITPINSTTIEPFILIKTNTSNPTNQPLFLSAAFTQPTVRLNEAPRINASISRFQSVSVVPQSSAVPIDVIKPKTIETAAQFLSFLTTIRPTVNPPEVVKTKNSSATSNQFHIIPAPNQLAVNLTESTTFQNQVYEGEIPDYEYPYYNECVNTTVILKSGQEIDESINCTVSTADTTTERIQEINQFYVKSNGSREINKNVHLSVVSFQAPVSNLPPAKPPAIAKWPQFLELQKKTIMLENLIIKPSTVYETQYASCLQLENVNSFCNGERIIIQPTNTIPHHSTTYKQDFNYEGSRINYELGEFAVGQEGDIYYLEANNPIYPEVVPLVEARSLNTILEPSEINYECKELPSSQEADKPVYKKLAPLPAARSLDRILEPSELDYEFEELPLRTATAGISTPNKVDNYLTEKWTDIKENGIVDLKIKYIDKIIPSVTTVTKYNYELTATIIVQNCLPLHLNNMPLCSSILAYQVDDIVPLEIIYY